MYMYRAAEACRGAACSTEPSEKTQASSCQFNDFNTGWAVAEALVPYAEESQPVAQGICMC